MAELGAGSGSSYPSSLDTNNTLEVDSPAGGKTRARADVPNDLAAAIVAIQTELGTDPAGTISDLKTRLAVSLNDDGTLKTNNALFPGQMERAKFEYASTTTITINSGLYELGSVARSWVTAITYTPGSGGSNSGSTDLGASETHYLYLDSSAIGTSTNLTAALFINTTTAPTYSQTKRGWYNGNDRCILSFTTDGSNNINEFFHSGELVILEDEIADQAAVDIDTTFTDISALSIPAFASRAKVRGEGSVTGVDWSWRPNGSSATTGHQTGITVNGGSAVFDVITDTSQIFEMKASVSNTAAIAIWTQGWYFPEGM